MNGPAGRRADRSTTTDGWWSTEIQVWWRDFDELGHMTAAAYPAAYEEAVGRFVSERWGETSPAYVTARTSIEYLSEVQRQHQPITVHVGVVRVGVTSFVLDLALSDTAGTRCAAAQTRYVAWDKNTRGPRPLDEAERSALLHTVERPELEQAGDHQG
ncbi:thioesterase family protein [Nocardioides panacisoli]|uniref:acyl-CoA thioesterase n=1 Tax=Nocardioides panacisoli TaxID=627624 RepID=UPI001C63B4D6|nr:thioesterase family protein [Nocardioides panacisoli]QYJ03526.1 thioesterase family protein [Nocardioides panacisoli]